MLENKCRSIFIEYETDKKLEEKSIQFFVNNLFLFTEKKYSIDNRKDVERICTAAVYLFPCLKREPSDIGGIVINWF